MKLLKQLTLIALSSLCINAYAQLPKQSLRAGGVAVIPLAPQITQVFFADKPVLITQENQQKYAVLGIPLTSPVGTLKLTTNQAPIQIQIQSYPYAQQKLSVKNQDYVNPSQDQLDRYAREAKEQNDIYNSFSAATWTVFPRFIRPTSGKFSNSFGRKRFFNGEARAPHSGLDIPAPVGQKVIAPAAGKVVAIGDYFFNGKTILIDHGQGLISMFCHLNNYQVQVGQIVQQGDLIAQVGKTGRVTGAHLHWGMSLNNARVDPQLFLN